MGRLARASIVAFAAYAGGAGIAYLAQLAVARSVGAEGYGNYAFVVAWMTVLAYLSAMGFEVSVLRFVSAYRAQRQWGLLHGVINYANRRAGAAGAAIIVLGLAGTMIAGARIPAELRATLIVGLPLVPLWALLWIRCSVIRALGGVSSALAPDRLAREGILVLLLGAAALAHWRVDAPLAMAATVASGVVAFGMANLAMQWHRSATVASAPADYAAAIWRRTALPLVTLAVTETIINRTGVVLLGWLGMIREAGIYSLAFNVSLLVLLPRTAVNVLFAPMVADLFARNDWPGLRSLTARTAWWTLAGALCVALPLGLLAEPTLRLFGAGFVSGVPVLRILLLGQILASAAGPQLFLLTMTGHERSTALVQLAAAVINVVAVAACITVAGMNGAAWATVATLLGLTVALALLIWRKLNLALGVIALFTLRGPKRPPIKRPAIEVR